MKLNLTCYVLFAFIIIISYFGCSSEPKSENSNSSGNSDTTPPVVLIITPTNNETVGTNFTAGGNVSDDSSGIDGVEIFISPINLSYTNIVPAIKGITTFSSEITVTNYGYFYIWAKAVDRSGNFKVTSNFLINAANIPFLNFKLPVENGLIKITNSGTLIISGTASVLGAGISNVRLIFLSTSNSNASTNDAFGTTNWAFNANLSNNSTNTILGYAVSDNGKTSQVQTITIIIDTSAPNISLSCPTDNQECPTNFTAAGALSDNISGVSNAVLHISPANFSYTNNYTLPASFSTNILVNQFGRYFIWMDTLDNAGNSTNISKISINIPDAPVLNITSPISSGFILTNTGNIIFSGTSGVQGGSITGLKVLVTSDISQTNITNDASGFTNWSYRANLVPNLTNLFYAYAVSDNGKTSPIQSIGIIADMQPPVINFISLTNNQLVGGIYNFSGTVNDSLSGVNQVFVKFDNGFFLPVSTANGIWQINYTNTSIGKHTNYVFASDKIGNISTTDSVIVEYTDELPSIIITNPAAGQITNATSINISGMAGIGVFFTISGVYIIKDGFLQDASLSVDKSSWIKENLMLTPNRTNIIIAMAVGSSGKTNYSGTNIFVVDTIPPVNYNILPASNSIINGSSYTFQGSVTDNFTGIDKVYVKLDDNVFTPASFSGNGWIQNYSISYGCHTNYVYAADKAGNISPTITNILLYPPALPAVNIIAPANNSITNNSVINISGSASTISPFVISKVEVSINNGPFFDIGVIPGSSLAWTLSNVQLNGNQTNTIIAMSIDSCNQTNYSSTVNIVPDTEPPIVNLTPLPAFTNINNFNVLAEAADNFAGVKTQYYIVDHNTANTFTGNYFNISGISDGSHTIYAWAADKQNNSSVTQSTTVFVDTTPPVVNFNSPANGQTLLSAYLNIIGYASDSGSGVKEVYFSADNGAFNKVNGDISWNTNFYLLNGPNRILKAYAVDNMNNTGLTQTISITVEAVQNENMVFVSGGTFTMGDSVIATPTHSVSISNFFISKYETAFDEWDAYHTAVLNSPNPSDNTWGRTSRPVININWWDAIAYCNWKSTAGRPARCV